MPKPQNIPNTKSTRKSAKKNRISDIYWAEFRERFLLKRPVTSEEFGKALGLPGGMARMFLNKFVDSIGNNKGKLNTPALEQICAELDLPLPLEAERLLRERARELKASDVAIQDRVLSLRSKALAKLSKGEQIALGLRLG